MARCGCGGACSCALVAGDNITVTGSGASANPWVVNAVVNCSSVRSCLSANNSATYNPATGVIGVCISTDANNNLSRGTDGCLYVAPGNNAVTAGCGLTGTGLAGSPLTAQTSTWPYPCDTDDNAGGVYCDASGVLRSDPPVKTGFIGATMQQTYTTANTVPSAETTILTHQVTFTNPDPCRGARIMLIRTADVDFDMPAGSSASFGIDGDDTFFDRNSGTSTNFSVHTQAEKAGHFTLAAGATQIYTMGVTLSRGSGGATYTRIQAALQVFAWSNP